VKQIM